MDLDSRKSFRGKENILWLRVARVLLVIIAKSLLRELFLWSKAPGHPLLVAVRVYESLCLLINSACSINSKV